MYGLCKVEKACIDNCPLFRPILTDLNIPNYKLAKFLVPFLKSLTTNEFTVKYSFHFAEEIFDQQPDFFIVSLNVDSLFTNILIEKTIEICRNEFSKELETVEGLSKSEFKELLFLATKASHFIFDGTLYKEINGVTTGSPACPTLASVFLAYYEKSWVESCRLEYRPFYYQRYNDDIFVLFNSPEHLKSFQSY